MASINTENLTFVDVSTDNVGDFYDNGNFSQALHDFAATPLGEAQVNSLREEMIAQMAAQGVEDYEPTDRQIYRALYNEQSSQDANYSQPDVTSEQMLDDHGPGWLQELGGGIVSMFGVAHDFVQEEVNPAIGNVLEAGTDLAVQGVTENDGLSGQAADALTSGPRGM